MYETGDATFAAPTVMAGLVPAIHVVQPNRSLQLQYRWLGPSIWAASKPNHVDGRDKPGHDGK
jgi:hypothetical protein